MKSLDFLQFRSAALHRAREATIRNCSCGSNNVDINGSVNASIVLPHSSF
jgi:hypothetical protein